MKKRKEHKLGERFTMRKLIYEVRENPRCEGCALFNEKEKKCMDADGHNFEQCSTFGRDDHKSVIFVQVGETKL